MRLINVFARKEDTAGLSILRSWVNFLTRKKTSKIAYKANITGAKRGHCKMARKIGLGEEQLGGDRRDYEC